MKEPCVIHSFRRFHELKVNNVVVPLDRDEKKAEFGWALRHFFDLIKKKRTANAKFHIDSYHD